MLLLLQTINGGINIIFSKIGPKNKFPETEELIDEKA
jgi:hypothetical protein